MWFYIFYSIESLYSLVFSSMKSGSCIIGICKYSAMLRTLPTWSRNSFGSICSLKQCITIFSRKESACISFSLQSFSLFFSLIDVATQVRLRPLFFNKTETALSRSISFMFSLLTSVIMFVTLPLAYISFIGYNITRFAFKPCIYYFFLDGEWNLLTHWN